MRKIRTAMVVFVAVFSLGIAGAPAASATILKTSCGSWSHGGGTAKACVKVNQHSYLFQLEGLWDAQTTVLPTNGYFTVNFDYVQLRRSSSGSIVVTNTADETYTLGNPSESTDWVGGCGADLYAQGRYKINHVVGGAIAATSGWIVRSTGATHSSDC